MKCSVESANSSIFQKQTHLNNIQKSVYTFEKTLPLCYPNLENVLFQWLFNFTPECDGMLEIQGGL
jgi:hypothetical protein